MHTGVAVGVRVKPSEGVGVGRLLPVWVTLRVAPTLRVALPLGVMEAEGLKLGVSEAVGLLVMLLEAVLGLVALGLGSM